MKVPLDEWNGNGSGWLEFGVLWAQPLALVCACAQPRHSHAHTLLVSTYGNLDQTCLNFWAHSFANTSRIALVLQTQQICRQPRAASCADATRTTSFTTAWLLAGHICRPRSSAGGREQTSLHSCRPVIYKLCTRRLPSNAMDRSECARREDRHLDIAVVAVGESLAGECRTVTEDANLITCVTNHEQQRIRGSTEF